MTDTITTTKGRTFHVTDERIGRVSGTRSFTITGARGATFALNQFPGRDYFEVQSITGRKPFTRARLTEQGWEVVA